MSSYNVYRIDDRAMAMFQTPHMVIVGVVEASDINKAIEAGRKLTPLPIIESKKQYDMRMARQDAKREYAAMMERLAAPVKKPVLSHLATPQRRAPIPLEKPRLGGPLPRTGAPGVRKTQFGPKFTRTNKG